MWSLYLKKVVYRGGVIRLVNIMLVPKNLLFFDNITKFLPIRIVIDIYFLGTFSFDSQTIV